jgi:hypothetical protein
VEKKRNSRIAKCHAIVFMKNCKYVWFPEIWNGDIWLDALQIFKTPDNFALSGNAEVAYWPLQRPTLLGLLA